MADIPGEEKVRLVLQRVIDVVEIIRRTRVNAVAVDRTGRDKSFRGHKQRASPEDKILKCIEIRAVS